MEEDGFVKVREDSVSSVGSSLLGQLRQNSNEGEHDDVIRSVLQNHTQIVGTSQPTYYRGQVTYWVKGSLRVLF